MIQIFSEQRAIFENPFDKEVSFTVAPYVFTYAPDWVQETLLWKWLEADKKVKVIKSAKDAIEAKFEQVETPSIKEAEEQVEEEPKLSDVDLEKYSKMKAKELYEVCISKGIDVEPKLSKAFYLEQLSK